MNSTKEFMERNTKNAIKRVNGLTLFYLNTFFSLSPSTCHLTKEWYLLLFFLNAWCYVWSLLILKVFDAVWSGRVVEMCCRKAYRVDEKKLILWVHFYVLERIFNHNWAVLFKCTFWACLIVKHNSPCDICDYFDRCLIWCCICFCSLVQISDENVCKMPKSNNKTLSTLILCTCMSVKRERSKKKKKLLLKQNRQQNIKGISYRELSLPDSLHCKY